MKQRTRIYYSDAQKAEIWDRWQDGESMHSIARSFDRFHTSVQRILTADGGVRPRLRPRAIRTLSLGERETISRGIASKLSMRAIAEQLGRSPSTVSREIQRNGGYAAYRAPGFQVWWSMRSDVFNKHFVEFLHAERPDTPIASYYDVAVRKRVETPEQSI
jgi:DNA-binding CsgD family transcriptional regulator